MKDDHFIYAYELGETGESRVLDTSNSHDMTEPKRGFRWLHMCSLHDETRKFLENETEIDPIIIDAMLADETRPRALLKDDGMLIILRAMNLNDGQDPEDMISIRMWIGERTVITTRRRDIKAIEDIVGLIQIGNGPTNPCGFLTMITDRMFVRMEPFLVDLEDRISKAEELLISGNDNEISNDVSLVRKRTTIFTRYITPQRTTLEILLKAKYQGLTETHREHLVESLDRVTRYVEELLELRERSQILNDEIESAHGRRLNDITYIFSVAATVFLPLSFLTGLMGINIGGMPGVDNNNSFWMFAGLCAVIVAIQVTLFKKLRWF